MAFENVLNNRNTYEKFTRFSFFFATLNSRKKFVSNLTREATWLVTNFGNELFPSELFRVQNVLLGSQNVKKKLDDQFAKFPSCKIPHIC